MKSCLSLLEILMSMALESKSEAGSEWDDMPGDKSTIWVGTEKIDIPRHLYKTQQDPSLWYYGTRQYTWKTRATRVLRY